AIGVITWRCRKASPPPPCTSQCPSAPVPGVCVERDFLSFKKRNQLADLHSRDRAGVVLRFCAQPNGLANEGLTRSRQRELFTLPLAPLPATARARSQLPRLGVEELERVREERPRDKRPHTPAPKPMHTAECCGAGQSHAASSRVFCRSALRA